MSEGHASIEPQLFAVVREFLAKKAAHRPVDDAQVQAWREFHRRCDPLIRKFACIYVKSASDVDDCAQEVWLKLIDRLVTFEYDPSRGAFTSWLYRIVRDTTVSYFRHEARFTAPRHHEPLRDVPCRPDADPAVQCERSDSVARSYAMVTMIRRHVSRPNYELLQMRWLQGCSVEEVAQTLGLSHEQVWYREHRARQKMRALLDAAGVGP